MRVLSRFLQVAAVGCVLLPTTVLASPGASGWSIQPTPNPAGAMNSFLPGVSCTTTSACTAVGYSISTSNVVTNLAKRWNGTAWSIQTIPNPGGAVISSLASVACTSSTACTAVGNSFNSANVQRTLAEHWNGTSWARIGRWRTVGRTGFIRHPRVAPAPVCDPPTLAAASQLALHIAAFGAPPSLCQR